MNIFIKWIINPIKKDRILRNSLLLTSGLMLVNYYVRMYYGTGVVDHQAANQCHPMVDSWESCATETHDFQVNNYLNWLDSNISFLMMAAPIMTESVLTRLWNLIYGQANRASLMGANTSIVGLGLARLMKSHIKDQIKLISTQNCISSYCEIFETLNVTSLVIRPEAAQKFAMLTGKAQSLGFPSGHSFTLFNRAIGHYQQIEESRRTESTINMANYVWLCLCIYASFTRYTLQWHTPIQIVITAILSIASMAAHHFLLNNNYSRVFNKIYLEQLINYVALLFLISTFGSLTFEKINEKLTVHDLNDPQFFYGTLLATNITLDLTTHLMTLFQQKPVEAVSSPTSARGMSL